MFTALAYGEPRTHTFETPYGHATRVSVDVFLENFLPTLSAGPDLSARVGSLRRRRKLWPQLVTKSERLWGYSRKIPSDIGVHASFTPLQRCFQKISTAFPGRNGVSFVFNNGGPWESSERIEDALPDAWLAHDSRSLIDSVGQWCSIAVSGVYQLKINKASFEDVRAPYPTSLPHEI